MTVDASVPIDYDAADLRVVACQYCPTWWAEVLPGAVIVVREWHASGCPVVEGLVPPDDLTGAVGPPAPADAATGDDEAPVEHAVGALMGLYGLSADAATTVLLLRASVVSLAPSDLAVRIVGLAPRIEVEESTRQRVTALLDGLGPL